MANTPHVDRILSDVAASMRNAAAADTAAADAVVPENPRHTVGRTLSLVRKLDASVSTIQETHLLLTQAVGQTPVQRVLDSLIAQAQGLASICQELSRGNR
jgi:hypothetical protein